MNSKKKIIINIPSDKLDLLKKFGLSPQDVFFRGYEELLKQKYKEFNLLDESDDEEDEIEWLEINPLTKQINNIDQLIINDNDVTNN
jgi:hypothetical protein